MQNLMCLTRTSGEAVNRAGRPQSGDITTQGVIDKNSPSKSMEDYKTKEGARSRLIHVPQSANYIVYKRHKLIFSDRLEKKCHFWE